ncbi:MAG: C25 family cysteine peptidase [Cellvibrionaceae bacterium]|nr:C25 family cysteine peptidase [Cellvibrionaceae bacterium]
MKHLNCKTLASGLGAIVLAMSLSNPSFASTTTTATKTTTSTIASTVAAQTSAREWVALTAGAAPGAKFKATVNKSLSSSSRTVIEGVIPGYWREIKKDPQGNQYELFSIPGMGSQEQVGAPDLPLYRFKLAVPQITDTVISKTEVRASKRLTGVRVWPQPIPELDGEKDRGTPEQFQLNKRIYAAQQPWPAANFPERTSVGKALRNIPAINGEFNPMRWNPSTGDLEIVSSFRLFIDHAGAQTRYEPITQERYQLAAKTFLNWHVIGDFKANINFYTASYLFVYPDSSFRDELLPLINQKKARGFKVKELTVDGDIGARTCTAIRNAIKAWEAAVPASHDAYALLVGDTDVIPLCTSPTGDQTDDLYASTNGDDLDEEIYLGRLSIDNQADLEFQVEKILAYQDNPESFCCYDRAVLWAHKENAPGKYVGAHETVRTNSYANPPTFITEYGHLAGVTDADIRDHVNKGIGLLAYRGHGSSTSTGTGWNMTSEYFNSSDVDLLNNSLNQAPVIWGFACTNAHLDSNDSIAEYWMEWLGGGAVSYYGATRTSYTSQNHVLDEEMFLSVYNEGLLTQSHAIQRAEAEMANRIGSANAWMYLLLGDPDMQIRIKNPKEITFKIPDLVRICRFCDLPVQVLDEVGNPIVNALVGIYKEDINGRQEIAANAYTNTEGKVVLSYSALTTGNLLIAAEDGRGNAVLREIPVKQ